MATFSVKQHFTLISNQGNRFHTTMYRNHSTGIAVTELTKKAGEMWEEVEDKTKWDEKVAEAKKEYEIKMAEYKASGGRGDAKPKASKDSSEKKKSPAKSPTKSSGSFKSKEYVSSSGSSSDSDAKPSKSKKGKAKEKAKEEKMEVDDEGGASTPASSPAEESEYDELF